VDEWALRDGTACAVCTRTLLAAWVTVGGKLQGVVIVGGNSIDRGLLSDGRTLALSELNQLHKYAGMLSLCASSDKLPASICSFTALRCFGEKVGYNFSIVSFDDRVTYGQQKCYNINQNL